MSPHDTRPGALQDPSPFCEPWQAQAFAMAVSLHEQGLFGWDEWAAVLSAELKRPGVAEDGSDYYACWLRALERVLDRKSITDAGAIDRIAAAWSRAAHATPHGQPVQLENDPQRHTG